MTRPLIGVTTSELRRPGDVAHRPQGEPGQPEMALGLGYLQAVERAGGIPVVLPPLQGDAIEPLLDRLCGVLLSGGPDLDPTGYGAASHAKLGPTEPALDAFEVALAMRADRRGMPLLGICRGAQALNVARGGTLHQHLPDFTDGSIVHRQTEPAKMTTHGIEVVANSLLESIIGAACGVNSFHHQAVDQLGRGLQAVAIAPDGVVEAIEAPGAHFYLGVQWHAETLLVEPGQTALFERHAQAAESYGAQRADVRAA